MSASPSTSRSSAAQPNSSGGGVLLSQLVSVLLAVLLLFGGWSLFVLLGVGPALGFHVITNTKPPNPSPNNQPKPHTVSNTEPTSIPKTVATIDYHSQEQRVLLKLQRREFETRTARLSSLMDVAEQQWKAWQHRVQPLLKNDEGRRLATFAPKVRFLFSRVPGDISKLNELRTEIDSVQNAFTQANAPLTDLDKHDRQLASVESEIRSTRTTFEYLNPALDELVAESKDVPTGPTLEDALAKLNVPMDGEVRKAAKEKVKAIRERQEDDIKKVSQDLASQSKDLLTAQDDLKRAEADAQRKLEEAKAQSTQQTSDLEQKRQVARKKMEEALPVFRDRLAPFISKGYRQLQTRQQFVVGIEAQPISYSALVRIGALVDDAKGIETLLLISDSNPLHEMNDRPNGAFPKYTSEFDIKNPEVIRELKAVQAFLRQHGEAMVEAKLLAP